METSRSFTLFMFLLACALHTKSIGLVLALGTSKETTHNSRSRIPKGVKSRYYLDAGITMVNVSHTTIKIAYIARPVQWL
jgi:hypothetical protein